MNIRIGVAMVLIMLGVVVIAISILGLFRLRDALERLHAGALTDTLGLLFMASGLGVLCGIHWNTAKLLLLVIILWATNPVSSHLIARMELITGQDIETDQLDGKGEQEL